MSTAPPDPAGALADTVAVLAAPPRGRRWRGAPSTDWPAFAPPVALAAGPLGVAQAADREIARQTALRAQALAEFAATRPATADRPQGSRGAMRPDRWAARPDLLREVSEWATPEVALALSRSDAAAEAELHRALTLVHRLPGTLAALLAGALHPGHLWPLLEHVAPVRDPRVRAEIEAECLRWAAGRVTTPGQLGDKARREVLARDARDAAQKLTAALRQRGVHVTPGRTAGMAELTAILTLPEARALHAALVALADTAEDDPADPAGPRSRGQKMADALVDLVLRPGETDLPIVQVLLTVVASIPTLAGGDQPGEIDGQTVPADMVRALLAGLTAGGIDLSDPAPDTPAEPTPAEPTADDADATPAPQTLARTGPADPAPTTPAHADVAPTDADPDPADPEAHLVPARDLFRDPAWEEFARREEHAWAAAMERRLLAGDFDDLFPDDPGPAGTDPPDPAMECAERRWQDEVERRILAGEFDGPPDLADDPPDPAATAQGGWWAAADRAVDAAGLALRRLRESLGHAERMVRTARSADAADQTAWRDGPGGRLTAATDALAALAACTNQRARLADLLDRTAGGGLADRPRIAVTAALTGALLALTDLPDLRRAAADARGLGPPGPTDGYRPAAALDRFLRARDRRCRQPGCRGRVPTAGELDHHDPYPDGPTAAGNMTGFCTTHHRGKHQAPGWTHHLAPDGTLTVTTPSGITTSTTPPPY